MASTGDLGRNPHSRVEVDDIGQVVYVSVDTHSGRDRARCVFKDAGLRISASFPSGLQGAWSDVKQLSAPIASSLAHMSWVAVEFVGPVRDGQRT